MPKVTLEHREARRRQILTAARDVFAAKGFAQTSTGDIVAAAGLSTGAVYSYFPSKNDLVVAVCDDAVETLLDAASVANLGELLDRIRTLSADRDHARLSAQVWAEAAVSAELASRVREQLQALRDKVAALIRAERAARIPPSPGPPSPGPPSDGADDLAEALLATLTGYSLRLAVGQDVGTPGFEQALRAIAGLAAP